MSSLYELEKITNQGKAEGWSESMILSTVRDAIDSADVYEWDEELIRNPRLNNYESEIIAQILHASNITHYDASEMYPLFMTRCKRYWSRGMFENLPVSLPIVNEVYAPCVGPIRSELERLGMSLTTHRMRHILQVGRRVLNVRRRKLSVQHRRFAVLAVVAMLHRLKFCSNVWYKWQSYPLTTLERALVEQAQGKYSVYVQLCGDFNASCPVPVLYLRQMHADYGFTHL